MENTTNGQTTQSGVDLAKYKQMFANHQANPKKNKRPSREEILAKYFVPRNDKEYFRILPPKQGKDFIETAFFHVIPVNAAGGKKKYRKIYCPAHNDPKVPKKDANGNVITDQEGKPVMVTKPCPLCEKSKETLKLQKSDPTAKGLKKEEMNPQQKAIKEENDKIWKASKDLEAKKFYIVRGIDKGAEKDGVKYWRFKHNFKQQGVLDKLGPAVTNWMEINGIDFTDAERGTDLILTVVDQEMQGRNRTYRDVSSIFPKGSSPLHADPIVVKEWLSDESTWRDVFKPASAPNISAHEYLEMVATGQAPYWDDSDQNNKKWVFPGRPDLEEKANTRDQNLDADTGSKPIEMASDVVNSSYDNVNIQNVTKEDVGTYQDNAVDLTAEIKNKAAETVTAPAPAVETQPEPQVEAPADTTSESSDDDFDPESGDYDDLPF